MPKMLQGKHPCNVCSSPDGARHYDDDTVFCFSCQTYGKIKGKINMVATTKETVKAQRTSYNRLGLIENMHLCNLIAAEYTTKGLTDSEFAAYASAKLEFKCHEGHIQHRRAALNIAATCQREVSVEGRVNLLEKQIAALINNAERAQRIIDHMAEQLGIDTAPL